MSATHRTKKAKQESPDQYYTQPGLARECVKRLVTDGWIRNPARATVLEASVGRGAWLRALLVYGFEPKNITVNDIDLDSFRTHFIPDYSNTVLRRILELDASRLQPINEEYWDLDIGNPPFNEAGPHIESAFERISATGIIAYLLPIGWFSARGSEDSRISWIKSHGRPAHHYIVSPRPKFRDGPGSDSATYSFVIWAPGTQCRETTTSTLDWYDEREVDRAMLRGGGKPSEISQFDHDTIRPAAAHSSTEGDEGSGESEAPTDFGTEE